MITPEETVAFQEFKRVNATRLRDIHLALDKIEKSAASRKTPPYLLRAFLSGVRSRFTEMAGTAPFDTETLSDGAHSAPEMHPMQIPHWVAVLDEARWKGLLSAVAVRCRDEAN